MKKYKGDEVELLYYHYEQDIKLCNIYLSALKEVGYTSAEQLQKPRGNK